MYEKFIPSGLLHCAYGVLDQWVPNGVPRIPEVPGGPRLQKKFGNKVMNSRKFEKIA
jgi:hypothetical protein